MQKYLNYKDYQGYNRCETAPMQKHLNKTGTIKYYYTVQTT